ncbi:MAG: preprotein translocase subunit SecY [Clostridia bacterium]|nr:preprotein translocase subunit SecY [Clostridia bacterium]
MWQRLINAFSDKDIRRKILFSLAMLLVFRLGCYIPVPGISYDALENAVGNNTLLGLMSLMSGGSLQYGTFFALGVLPFINSYIIMQLLTLVIPKLDQLSKQGDEGREKVTMITRYIAIALGLIQGVGIVVTYHNGGVLESFIGENTEWFTGMFIIIMLTAGSCFVMWLSERITEYGITNGTSLIIFVGIIATFGQALLNTFINVVPANTTTLWNVFGYILIIIVLFAIIVYMDGGERRIKVNYAKMVRGNKMYGGQSTYIPLKITSGGVMPIIFASAFMMFPTMIVSFLDTTSDLYVFYYTYLYATGTWTGNFWVGNIVYYLFMFIFVIFFSYFYAQIQFNPQDVARNLQQYGGTIQGIRAGRPTVEYLQKVNNRITLFGALFLAFIAIIPALLFNWIGGDIGLRSAFSATGMLIVVSVALELDKQLEAQYMSKHYKGFLK